MFPKDFYPQSMYPAEYFPPAAGTTTTTTTTTPGPTTTTTTTTTAGPHDWTKGCCMGTIGGIEVPT